MANKVDATMIMALGRNFAIGTLYNHIEDVVIPRMRLWDPSDVSRLATVKSESKETVKIHSVATEDSSEDEDDVDDDEHGSLLSDLGMDDHSAMSLMAGLLRPTSAGAWQYAIDRTDFKMGSFDQGPKVAVHCRSSSRKVSVDPTRLEMICRPERLIKSQATHVVVAVTYGLEAFCIFSPQLSPNPDNSTNEDDTAIAKILDYAHYFANGLLNGRNRLEMDQDEEDEDGRLCLIPLDLQCILYSDSIGVKSGQSWTSKYVAEQYEACKKVMEHQASTAIPLRVWLYPLHKLMPTEASISKIPRNILNPPRNLVIRWEKLWNRLRRVCREMNSLVHELEILDTQQSSTGNNWIPPNYRQRIKDFDGLMVKFTSALRFKLLSEWTTSVRKGAGLSAEMMLGMIEAIENKSPFITKGLSQWLRHQRHQIKTLNILVQLPGIRLLIGADQLKKETRNQEHDRSFAVVLHLPSLAEKSDSLVHEMSRFVDVFSTSHLSSWTNWTSRNIYKLDINRVAVARRRFFVAGQEFSDWVTNCNRDTTNVKYMVFYNDELINDCETILPAIKLYDSRSGDVLVNNYIIPKAPSEVTVEKNYRGVIQLSWKTAEEEVEQPSFLLQYRIIDRSGDKWDSIHHNSTTITINYLQSEESYVFRVAKVTPGGKSPFSPVSCEVTIDPVCPPPTGLNCRYATNTSITISWYHSIFEDFEEDMEVVSEAESEEEMEITMKSFAVECWADGNQDLSFIQRSTTSKSITLEPLVPDTVYCVQVRAVCTNPSGSIFYSLACRILKTRTLREAERAALVVRRASIKCLDKSPCPGIDFYTLPVKKHRGPQTQGIGHYIFGESSYLALAGKHRQRTILMLGATGSGKSTLINAMVNYVLGIEWDDDFRFKLIDELADKSQAHSQTDLVTTYDLYEMKDSRLNYSLTVVDTPGFGDTRGLEQDTKIMQQIQDYFQCSVHGIRQLEAVCFVVQSSLPRLTATQQYIFDSILSIFGQDIKENIRLMVTFADNAEPPVLGAVKEAGIPSPMDPTTGLPLHHKFNSSIFFATNKGDRQANEFNRTYFDLAVEGFDKFFNDLSRMEAKSLTLTREVLEERKRLEALVEGLQMKTEIKLTRIDEFQQIKKTLSENREQIDANKDFEFEVEFLVPKETDISRTGQFTTNCQKCRTTCHFPCSQAHDVDKHRCSVMNSNGYCTICKCHWKEHFNQKYRYEMEKKKVKRSSDAIRQQYQDASSEAMTNEQLLERIQKDIDEYEAQLMELMQATYPCIQRLNEIALRPHPFSAPAYIDLMIEAEKKEHRTGYQQRIGTLQKLRQMADIKAKLIQDQRMSTPPQCQGRTDGVGNRRSGRWYTQLTGIRTPISLFIEFFGWPVTLVILACLTALDISLFYDRLVILPGALRLLLWSKITEWAVEGLVIRTRAFIDCVAVRSSVIWTYLCINFRRILDGVPGWHYFFSFLTFLLILSVSLIRNLFTLFFRTVFATAIAKNIVCLLCYILGLIIHIKNCW